MSTASLILVVLGTVFGVRYLAGLALVVRNGGTPRYRGTHGYLAAALFIAAVVLL